MGRSDATELKIVRRSQRIGGTLIRSGYGGRVRNRRALLAIDLLRGPVLVRHAIDLHSARLWRLARVPRAAGRGSAPCDPLRDGAVAAGDRASGTEREARAR